MTEIISAITSVFTSAIGWVGTVATTIGEQPILLISCVSIPLCGLGVGVLRCLFSARSGHPRKRGWRVCALRTPPLSLLNLHFQNGD